MLKNITATLTTIVLIIFANITPLFAHEFWIEPDFPTGDLQLKMFAHVRVGQNFKGPSQYYIPDDIVEIKITNANGSFIPEKIIGDYPVFNEQAKQPGLQILSYHSANSILTYKTADIFQNFVRSKGLDWVLLEHKKRGLPDSGFKEFYMRYAKALVTRGGTSGNDKVLGFRFELIALKNPYELDKNAGGNMIPLKLIWEGKPFANSQISVFERTGEELVKSHISTNDRGIAELPVTIGRTYMLNSVQMTEENPESDAVWKSHWASLTFTAVAKK